MGRVNRLESDDCVIFGARHNLMVALSRRPELPTTFALGNRHIATLSSCHPNGICVALVVQHPDLPGPGYRKSMQDLLQRYGSDLRGVAVVIENDGFAASTQRSIATGILLLARATSAVKVFRTVQECAPWLAGRLDHPSRDFAALSADLAVFRETPDDADGA